MTNNNYYLTPTSLSIYLSVRIYINNIKANNDYTSANNVIVLYPK
jgi:hypothetical protein